MQQEGQKLKLEFDNQFIKIQASNEKLPILLEENDDNEKAIINVKTPGGMELTDINDEEVKENSS